MGTPKRPDLGPVHPCMGVTGDAMGVKDVMCVMGVMDVKDVKDVKDVSPGAAVMGGPQVESLGQAATLVILITVTVAQRVETRTSEVTHGILHTGDF